MVEENEGEHYFSGKPKSRHRIALISCFLRGNDYRFFTDASTFSKAKIDAGTRLLIKFMGVKPSDTVLDLGCGYGPIGIVAANLATDGKCYMVDINERAIELAKRNIKLNNVTNAEVRLGDMFRPLGRMLVDVILTNPPIRAGRKVVLSSIEASHDHLKKGGTFYLVIRTRQGAKTIREKMEGIFGNAEYVSIHGGYRLIMSRKV